MTAVLFAMTETFLTVALEIKHFIYVEKQGFFLCSSPLQTIKVSSSVLKPCIVFGARLQEKSEQMQDRRSSIYRSIKFSVWLIPMLIIQQFGDPNHFTSINCLIQCP